MTGQKRDLCACVIEAGKCLGSSTLGVEANNVLHNLWVSLPVQ